MRRVGQDLGVAAMSLYRYVSGREALLEAVVEKLMDGVTARADAVGFTSWQGYLQVLANEVRRVAQAHPAAFPLVASRHPATPWLRPAVAQHRAGRALPRPRSATSASMTSGPWMLTRPSPRS
ncbi:hypothetical protein LP422_18140 [Janibacter limosus]|uniref:Uncharacterized protein n=2 Tax=Janibacter limosus TaxID=53458 RepID=A0AC61U930_9MICO|nr:hypothetical protein [Janibacter limosus]UUZ46413.1 hypothetical protein LP422_18140 [Janibacter limosus]